VQIFFLVCETFFFLILFFFWKFILAEKKEEKDKHDKQRNKSNNTPINNNHTQCNGDGQNNRVSNLNGDTAVANSLIEDTWIHELFQGTLVSTTKCLNCETV
jgi:hypothetical protein